MKKKYFGWSGVYFIFILHLYITVTCRHTCTIVFYGKDCFSNIKRHRSTWNIWTFSRRFSRNLTPRETKKKLCFIYLNNLVKYFSGARLRRCLISSKTVEKTRAKFHEIRKTNNTHDVTMASNTYRFCWKQVLASKVWCRL